MSNNLKTYQWMTAILAILVIVLGIALYNAKQPEVDSNLEQAKVALEECSSSVRSWSNEYGNDQTSDEARSALAEVLSECAESLE